MTALGFSRRRRPGRPLWAATVTLAGLAASLALTLGQGEASTVAFGFWCLASGTVFMLAGLVLSRRVMFPGHLPSTALVEPATAPPPRGDGCERAGLALAAGGAATFVLGIFVVLIAAIV